MTKHTAIAPSGASENWESPQAVGTPTQVFADDGGYQYKQRIYAQAAAGDAAGVAQSCAVNGP